MFHCAGNEDVALLLVERGCNTGYHDSRHISPFEDAITKGQAKVSRLVLQTVSLLQYHVTCSIDMQSSQLNIMPVFFDMGQRLMTSELMVSCTLDVLFCQLWSDSLTLLNY